jgi:hypothetical protein
MFAITVVLLNVLSFASLAYMGIWMPVEEAAVDEDDGLTSRENGESG